MQSFIGFVLRFNLDFHCVLIILDKYRSIADKCALNGAANLLPRVLFVVELKGYGKHDYFVNVYSDVPLLSRSLQKICAAWCFNFQVHFPNAYEKLILSWNILIIWRIYDQERGIG